MFYKSSALTYDQKQYVLKHCSEKTINEIANEIGAKYTTIHSYIISKGLEFKKDKGGNRKVIDSFEINGFFNEDNYAKMAII